MKFVQNNKILEDSNAETAEISAEKTKTRRRTRRRIAPPLCAFREEMNAVAKVEPVPVFSALSSAFSASLR
jgi:hypothetical protein